VETVTFRPPAGYDITREHLRNFFDSVRSRKPVVEDTVFGNNTAIACFMANASYFQKSIVHWDAAAREIRS